jgi:hypothetical protein
MGVGGQRHAPATLPPGKTWYPLYIIIIIIIIIIIEFLTSQPQLGNIHPSWDM